MGTLGDEPKFMNKDKKVFLFVGALIPVLTAVWLLGRARPVTPSRFWAVGFSNDGKTLVTVAGGNNPEERPRHGELVFWDLARKRETLVLEEKSTVRALACSADGEFVAIGEFNGSAKLLNSRTSKIIATLPPHEDLVNAVAISSDSKLIASGSFDGAIILCNNSGRRVDTLTLPGEKILNIAISPDSRLLAASTRKGSAFLFDLANQREPRKLAADPDPETDEPKAEIVAFAPDSRTLITGCREYLRLWDASNGALLRGMKGVSAAQKAAVFSPDGKTIASVDAVGTLTLWNPATGKSLNSVRAHSGPSFGVAYSSDGKLLATVSRTDYAAKIWDAESLALISTLQRKNVTLAP